jgi:RHS repeat-associated protein
VGYQSHTSTDVEPGIGLQYLQQRYYDPLAGRFISADPIGFAGGLNVYGYASNDPIGRVDPFGLYDQFDEATDFFAGWGDVVSIGLARPLRGAIGADLGVNYSSPAYRNGLSTGFLNSAAMGAGGLLKTLAPRLLATGGAIGATGAYLAGSQGGPGLGRLADRTVFVSEKGLAIAEAHVARFGQVGYNTAMIERLRTALSQRNPISGADASFYLHEIREATLMGRGMEYAAAHCEALNRYGVSPFSVYHPQVIQAMPQQFGPSWFEFWKLPR